jgi:hypothetical protein
VGDRCGPSKPIRSDQAQILGKVVGVLRLLCETEIPWRRT